MILTNNIFSKLTYVIILLILIVLTFGYFYCKQVDITYNCIIDQNNLQPESKGIDLFRKPNDIVFKYVSLPMEYSWGSGVIPLTVAALLSQRGDILELGCGGFSTPILHRIGAEFNRQVVSVDVSLEWVTKLIIYNTTSTHKIYHVKNSDLETFGRDKSWGLVLVDHGGPPAYTRSTYALDFAHKAKIVVAHDAEKMSEKHFKYEKNKVKNHFKYACKYTAFQNKNLIRSQYVSTWILSNYIDLKDLKSIFDAIPTDHGHVACDSNY